MTTATQDAAAEWLFSYGTLQLEPVQRATFGRLLSGQPDSLSGYRLEQVAIRDAAVVATSGKAHHPMAVRTGKQNDRIEGTVFEITAAELAQADDYEVEDYQRARATLASGRQAWVYVEAGAGATNFGPSAGASGWRNASRRSTT
ncbi:gamma-glutamylcyclotransferase family protein [Variovorax sp. dw_954]|uniref:gamma-glutamylcyclotransferase family protein n=1 Tax=Variovorax sp. dw_954 TaxID=2720078 RepID=UPI001BD29BDA|nr:gamma-glutamylcyclotransferase family protein [Variovorax sp. dw_954]